MTEINDQEMPLLAHLAELRNALLKAIVAVLLVFLALMPFANRLYSLLAKPLLKHLPANASMIATDVAAPFFAPFKLTFVVALFIAIPYVLYQIWGFIAPGLYRHEKRFAVPLLVSSVMLFYTGCAFAYFVVFPVAFAFFTSTAPEGVTVMTDITNYLDFVLSMFLAFGLAFEIPVATVLLAWTGIVETESLRQGRPYVVVGCFAIGAVFTPPDVLSQLMLAVPMWLLFEAGLICARLGQPKKEDESSQELAANSESPDTSKPSE